MPSSQPPIFYINLDTRPDRRAFMERQFARLGLTAQRIECVTTADLTAAAITWGAHPHNPWPMMPSEIACAHSHRRAWRALLVTGEPAGVILEDDAVIDDTLPAILAAHPLERCDTQLLRLETVGNPVHLASRGVELASGVTAHRLLGNTYGSAAYILGAALAQRLVDDPHWDKVEPDRYLFGRGGPNLFGSRPYQVVPAPCIQLNFVEASPTSRSDIVAARAAREARPLGPIAHLRRNATLIPYVANLGIRLLADPAALRRGRAPTPAASDGLAWRSARK